MKQKKLIIFLLTGAMLLSGCSAGNSVSAVENSGTAVENSGTAVENSDTAVENSGTAVENSDTVVKNPETADTAESAEAAAEDTAGNLSGGIDTSDMFTDRDREIGYDEEVSARILLADGESTCDSNAVRIDGNTITITDEGTYILSGEVTDGMIIVDAQDTDKVQLVLCGVKITSAQSAAVYVRSADKVFVTTASDSENILTNGGTYTAIDENNIDAVIFSKDDLTLNGSGTLTIHAEAGHGVVSKDDLVLTSGVYEIEAEKHGLSGKDSVRIADGTYEITSGKDGIHASNEEDTSLGFIYIAGGSFEITSADDGMHADSALRIDGGRIHVAESYEGLEGLSIDITGGDIDVTASDDGLNAAGGNDSSGFRGGGGDIFAAEGGVAICISGGTLHVNASGDGIDSNGTLTISGGETYVSGPTDGGNSSLDYNGGGVITGGIFVAAGSYGMAQNFSSSSTQGAMMAAVDVQAAESVLSLRDSSGKELISWTADKEYASVIVSCPEIVQGETYTLTAGNSTQEITMDSLVYGSGSMGGQRGGAAGKGGMGSRPEGSMPGRGGMKGHMGETPDGAVPGQEGQINEKPDGTVPDQGSPLNGTKQGEDLRI